MTLTSSCLGGGTARVVSGSNVMPNLRVAMLADVEERENYLPLRYICAEWRACGSVRLRSSNAAAAPTLSTT